MTSPLDALWWGLTTMTTVGYGDVFPTTGEGRVVAAVLLILGIGLYSIVTATVTSFLITDDRAGPADLAGQLERLAALHADGRVTDEELPGREGGRVTDEEYRSAKAAVLMRFRLDRDVAPSMPRYRKTAWSSCVNRPPGRLRPSSAPGVTSLGPPTGCVGVLLLGAYAVRTVSSLVGRASPSAGPGTLGSARGVGSSYGSKAGSA